MTHTGSKQATKSTFINALNKLEARKKRQLEIEREQRLEDAEAWRATEEQLKQLLEPFQSVKFEFYDLDGLQWTKTALRKRKHCCRPTILPVTSRLEHSTSRSPSPDYDIEATVRGSSPLLNRHDTQSCKQPKRALQRSRPSAQLCFGINDNASHVGSESQSFMDFSSTEDDGYELSFPKPPTTIYNSRETCQKSKSFERTPPHMS